MKVKTIGRNQDNDVVVNDYRVSRTHLQIVQNDSGNCSVVDLNSVNGTFVNGQRITGEYYLQANDIVKIGDTILPWQTYFQTPINESPQQKNKSKRKTTMWIVLAVALTLLVGGGIGGKIYYDKQQEKMEIEKKEKEEAQRIQEEKEQKIAEEKRLQDEADELARKELISQRDTEKKAKEEVQKAKEIEKKQKEEAEAKATEKDRLAKEKEREKDRAEFDQLKIEAEKLIDRGANPADKINQMKKIAKKYPNEPYFSNTIKILEN